MIDLLPQQKEAKDKLSKWKVGALFMEPGTAKTRIAIELANQIKDIDLVSYIAPLRAIKPVDKNIKSIIEEVNKWGGFNTKTLYTGIESIQASDRIYLELREQIKNSKKPFIICDESIKIKNVEAKRTRRLLDIGRLTNYKLILNGTPITRNLLDLWSQMEFLSPKILSMTLLDFKNTFCEYKTITKRNLKGKIISQDEIITGYENIDYLYSLLKNYIFECSLDLKIKQYWKDEIYTLSDEEKEEYYTLKEKYLDDEVLLAMNNNIFLEMTQKMQHSYCITEDKFNILEYWFKNYPEKENIIFCKYIKSMEECKKRYPKATVLNYMSSSYSLNLQHLPYTVFFDKNWDYALRDQSSRRNYRTGQEKDVRYLDLTGDVGLEKLINKNIEKKTSQAEYFKNISQTELKKVL